MDGIDEEPNEAEEAKTISKGLQVFPWKYFTCIILLFLCGYGLHVKMFLWALDFRTKEKLSQFTHIEMNFLRL